MNRKPMYYGVDLKKTGENIDRMRMDSGLSVRDVQEYMGFVEPRAVYKWLRGEAVPSLEHLRVLNQILGQHIEDIVAWTAK